MSTDWRLNSPWATAWKILSYELGATISWNDRLRSGQSLYLLLVWTNFDSNRTNYTIVICLRSRIASIFKVLSLERSLYLLHVFNVRALGQLNKWFLCFFTIKRVWLLLLLINF